MATGATRKGKGTSREAVLHMALELDDLRWTLTMGTCMGRRPRQRRVRPRDREAVPREIRETKRRFGLPGDVRVVSCYAAGREAFWLHRWLESEGIENRVVDSASTEVLRRRRLAKAERLDGKKLLRMLIRHESGERGATRIPHHSGCRRPRAQALLGGVALGLDLAELRAERLHLLRRFLP